MGVNWGDLDVLSDAGINWGDLGVLSQAGVNWGEIIKKARADFDLTVLLIEHDMKFVNQLCDKVLVLDYGKTIFEGKPSEAIKDPEVIAAYLGDFHND